MIRPVTTAGGQLYFAMLVESAVDTPSRHGFEFTEDELLKTLDAQREQGAYPMCVVPYEAGGQWRFAATFREDPTMARWELIRDVSSSALKTKAAALVQIGMTPASIMVYPVDGEARYAVVWRQKSHSMQAQ